MNNKAREISWFDVGAGMGDDLDRTRPDCKEKVGPATRTVSPRPTHIHVLAIVRPRHP